MIQNYLVNTKVCPSKRPALKGRAPREHVPQKGTPQGRVPLGITLSIALMLLHPFAAQASPGASVPGTPVPEARAPEAAVSTARMPAQNSQVLKLAENKRLEAAICAGSMNRIAVANDRITQIFGDEGTFESQNDEVTGQVFLKPTLENGLKSLSLTLITEQGAIQDLTLNPTAKSAKTLILGRDASGAGDGPGHQNSFPRDVLQPIPGAHLSMEKALTIQEQLLTVLKQAMNGQLPTHEEGISHQDPSPEGYSLTPNQSWQSGPYVIHSFQVENVTETPLPLQEKDFYQPGDLALSFGARIPGISPFGTSVPGASIPDTNVSGTSVSGTSVFQDRVLSPGEQITFYVVCYRKADLS